MCGFRMLSAYQSWTYITLPPILSKLNKTKKHEYSEH